MITKTIQTNGTNRTITAKIFKSELRIYKIYGDISRHEELEEMAQELSLEFNCETVKFLF